MKVNYSIEELIPGYCAGTATVEECKQVEAWMSLSEENREVAKQIRDIYMAGRTVYVLNTVDTEKALKKVKGKMIVREWKKGWGWMQRAAAVLFIPLLILLFVKNSGETAPQLLVQELIVKTNPGMTTSIILPDSTLVYLNSESSLVYPSSFEGDTRNVMLIGEAYFEVAKNAKQPFVVSTSRQTSVEVTGTRFNVESYEDTPDIVTTLVEGKVNFLLGEGGVVKKRLPMTPGEKLIYNKESKQTRLLATTCEAETSWKDGKIIFRNTSLAEALRMLEKRFNIEFVGNNRAKLGGSFTGTFTNQRLERILEYFRISSKISWRYVESKEIKDERTKIEIY